MLLPFQLRDSVHPHIAFRQWRVVFGTLRPEHSIKRRAREIRPKRHVQCVVPSAVPRRSPFCEPGRVNRFYLAAGFEFGFPGPQIQEACGQFGHLVRLFLLVPDDRPDDIACRLVDNRRSFQSAECIIGDENFLALWV